MTIDVLTLFPEMFEPINQSILGRAQEKNIIDINVINIRDFSENKHKKVDDTPYGGGAGMVMQADVVYDAYKSIKDENAKVIYLTPQGKVLNQKKVEELSKQEHLILKKKISNRDSIVIFERGEPVFFEKNHLEIRLSNRIDVINIDIDNAGKPLTKKNIDIIQRQDFIEVTIHKNDGKTIVYSLIK